MANPNRILALGVLGAVGLAGVGSFLRPPVPGTPGAAPALLPAAYAGGRPSATAGDR